MISSPILLTMRNVSDKSCTQNQNTYFIFNNDFPKVVPFMRYVGKYCRFGQATDNMMPGIASWIPKTTVCLGGAMLTGVRAGRKAPSLTAVRTYMCVHTHTLTHSHSNTHTHTKARMFCPRVHACVSNTSSYLQ